MDKSNLEKITALRHELHAHPELSMQEVWTKAHLIGFIKSNTGLKVVDCGRWFYAVYTSKNLSAKKLGFRADFDALPISETCSLRYVSAIPGVSHKCGHDGHSAALAGLALEIDQHGCDNTIYFIFQHAEETGQGGEECAQFIEDEGIEMVFAVHNRSGYPKGSIVYREGLTQCASKGLTIYFEGKQAHASQPEDGINPAPAIAEVILYINELLGRIYKIQASQASNDNKASSRKCLFKEMILCTIVGCNIGQKDFGIAAGWGELSLTLRANREDDLNLLEALICDRAEKSAARDGLNITYEISDPFPETRNHPDAIKAVLEAAGELKLQTISMPEPWRASEDFGYYTKKCPGAIFYIGNGEDYPMVHTGDYDFNDEILEIITEMYKHIAKNF